MFIASAPGLNKQIVFDVNVPKPIFTILQYLCKTIYLFGTLPQKWLLKYTAGSKKGDGYSADILAIQFQANFNGQTQENIKYLVHLIYDYLD